MDAVAHHGSIRKAAEPLHIASSALNRRILDLEADVGSPLFERLPRGVRATAAGELFLAYVRRSLKELRLVEAQIDGLRGLVHGRVRIAVAESVTGRMLPDAIAEYHQRHPGVGFSVTVGGRRKTCLQITAPSDLESVWLSEYSRQRATLGFIGRRWSRWSRAAMSR